MHDVSELQCGKRSHTGEYSLVECYRDHWSHGFKCLPGNGYVQVSDEASAIYWWYSIVYHPLGATWDVIEVLNQGDCKGLMERKKLRLNLRKVEMHFVLKPFCNLPAPMLVLVGEILALKEWVCNLGVHLDSELLLLLNSQVKGVARGSLCSATVYFPIVPLLEAGSCDNNYLHLINSIIETTTMCPAWDFKNYSWCKANK